MTRLSVVVAARDASTNVRRCLKAIQGPLGAIGGELIIVAPEDSAEAQLAEGFGLLFTVPGRPLVPDLWRVGILHTRSDWVAITTAQCVPDDRWVGAMLAAIDDSAAAVGGPVLPGSIAAVEMAAFLLRYSSYLPPLDRHDAVEVPGDNAAYRRSAIDRVSASWGQAFWENDVNTALRANGERLIMDPRPVVRLVTVGSASAFMSQRFQHGRIYGAGRRSLARALASPVVPAVMLSRILSRVGQHPEYAAAAGRSAGWLLADVLAWTAGETIGLVAGR